MNRLIGALFARSRSVLLVLLALLAAGGIAYVSIAKEAAPDVDVPIFFVSVSYPGISPEDSERLLIRPLERELSTIEGLDEVRASAGEGFALLRLDFHPGYDNRRALAYVREEVDLVRPDLPPGAEEPVVTEVDLSMFPVLTAALSGSVPESTLVRIARDLRDRIEAVPGVLEVEVGGEREDLLEVMVDPRTLETYELPYNELIAALARNNQLVAAGAMDTGAGRVSIKVPGVIESVEDILEMPVIAFEGTVVTFDEVATARRTFKDPEGFARIDGQPAISLEIRKRGGANILDTVAAARQIIDEASHDWLGGVEVRYLQDQARDVRDLLGDLENHVLIAILLVMLVIVAALGGRSSWLVGLSIPGAFLGGILVLYLLGYTLNIVVLFSLILVVGMLVDGAIVVIEQADRYLAEGRAGTAYRDAAQRMAWPIIASVITTLAVFLPMLFWPGMVGEFMFYLPATVIITLLMSLAMALVFIPVLAASLGADRPSRPEQVRHIRAAEAGRFDELDGGTGRYVALLRWTVVHPAQTLAIALVVTGGLFVAYAELGRGVDFFPEIEPRFAQIQVQARGDLSVWEADDLVRSVEARLLDRPSLKTVYARTIGSPRDRLVQDYAEDVIGVIQLEFVDWQRRPPAAEILDRLRADLADIPGVRLQFLTQSGGPEEGKPVVLEVAGERKGASVRQLAAGIEHLREGMRAVGGFVDVEDDRPLPGVEVRLEVDHREAARFGADVNLLGRAVQMLTRGVELGDYRPVDADEEVEIRVRFPFDERNLAQLVNLRVPTQAGLVPVRNFVEFVPAPKTGIINRVDGRRTFTIEADVAPGRLVDERVRALTEWLDGHPMPPGLQLAVRGQQEEQAEAGRFLTAAFVVAIALMFLTLVTQFNSLYQAGLVLSAIVISTGGVLLALILRGEPFSIVMSGIGVIALAGVVVNDNIVLIDTFNQLRREGIPADEAALRTGAQRLRPVVLTSVTTVLGLAPMVFGLTIDLIGREFSIGAPSTQYWVQLATAIAGGLIAATMLTLLFTPSMLAWVERRASKPA
ncbi:MULTISPECIES: efflux RND transporter permease subunit [unclassified Guyparkeria]|uniref:efflux RND transporter permease subunit n=1 Tax=unclassified Guyparkeria TaxID=2626246 RepID=UPI00073380C6|nr:MULTISPECIES: efflux RND transporter permease subunit [unclassified Guyparkeria]KTG17293.1 acriflavin resistance protein [Guyparkeria sp. XI15]OAE87270.1 acriflavin resistance protein [Guyparkeria sp. WRN-7]